MKTLRFLLAVCALASGCVHPHRGHVVPHAQSRRVHHVYDTRHDPGYVEVHVHTHDCGHNVVEPTGSHHGPHAPAPRVHVHGEDCGHVRVKVHTHGKKCGHLLVDGEWVAPGQAKKKKKD